MGHYTVHTLICLCWYYIYICTATTAYKAGIYGHDPVRYEIVVPRKVDAKGGFLSHVIPHHYKLSQYSRRKRGDVSTDDTVHYLVPIAGEDHHLELRPSDGLLTPHALMESRHAGRVSVRRVRDGQCHFKGTVRGHPGSSVALSTCSGLAGYIRSRHGHFLIEPAAAAAAGVLTNDRHPHLVYQRHTDDPGRSSECETRDHVFQRFIRQPDDHKKKNETTNMYTTTVKHDLHLEILLVLDKSFLNYHRELDVENYVLTVMNMAHNLFLQDSLGQPLYLVIVRIIRLEDEDSQINIAVTKNPSKTLKHFQEWQNKINPGNDSHPYHHDLAILFTRVDIYRGDMSSDLLGLARLAGACDPHKQAAICQDNGLVLGFVVAHEVGHTLGLVHDNKESGCKPTLPNGLSTVMAPKTVISTGDWSDCSKKSIKLFIESGFGSCLTDAPSDHPFLYKDVLPGTVYDGDWQCQSAYGSSASLCNTGVRCDTLRCNVPKEGCIDSGKPPADGTSCGENKWCYRGECIEVGERPGALDGGWGPWSPWSPCSRTCGSGIASAVRRCDSPEPSNGGKACKGEKKKYMVCETDPCDVSSPRFRDVQCAEFNEWVFPEDGKKHEWKSHFVNHDRPCALYCISENGIVANLATRVIDGTSCLRGIRDICIAGKCVNIPCDLNIESNAVEDACGVCHGDGTTCALKEGQKFFHSPPKLQNATQEVVKLIDIPEDTQNIKVEETEPTASKIQVRNVDGSVVLITGFEPGMYNVPGSRAWLGMIRVEQEALHIPGPVTDPLSIWILLMENVTIRYSLAVKTEKRSPMFSWDYVDWTVCSAACGPGTSVSVARCVEQTAGVVDDRYCSEPKPKDQAKTCEKTPCKPRWIIGEWQSCGATCTNPSSRLRMVKCMKPVGDKESDLILLQDSQCPKPKPKEEEECGIRTRRKVFHRPNHPSRKAKLQTRQNMAFKLKNVHRFRRNNETANCKFKNRKNGQSDALNKFSLERGKTVIDKLNPAETKLTISADPNSNEDASIAAKQNTTVITLKGKQAIQELEKIEQKRPKNDQIK